MALNSDNSKLLNVSQVASGKVDSSACEEASSIIGKDSTSNEYFVAQVSTMHEKDNRSNKSKDCHAEENKDNEKDLYLFCGILLKSIP